MRLYVVTKRNLIIAAAIFIAVVLLIIALLAWGGATEKETIAPAQLGEYELEVATAKNKQLPIYSVARSDKKIALTIDAAWEADKTPEILKILDTENIKATFFLVGLWVDKYPDAVKLIAQKGHEIGNHTNTHPHMNTLTSAQISKELKDMDDKLEKLTGKRSTLFRAPYGEYNDNVIQSVRTAGYEVIQWNVDTVDWREERTTDMILSRCMKLIGPGGIILCHNNGYKIEDYLPTLIKQLKNKGYEFTTVSNLLLSGSTTIDVNGIQQPKQS